eukprot:CAMPEP_0115326238 /NCGR_PEP_ID=MMETSP0270-20121206/83459_1 /TAXON_ID=71861 /ORGANISM="Scrippsiella trochoidea, Strain CCMP3099" /LENGTH=92 /DNA_ID=CAMNT_0002746517 /DNA_START=197 /DNA_END=475 /DNA_ORIENTATION=-
MSPRLDNYRRRMWSPEGSAQRPRSLVQGGGSPLDDPSGLACESRRRFAQRLPRHAKLHNATLQLCSNHWVLLTSMKSLALPCKLGQWHLEAR